MESPFRFASLIWSLVVLRSHAERINHESRILGPLPLVVACLGFFSFASGLALFADGLKRDIVEQLRRDRADQAA